MSVQDQPISPAPQLGGYERGGPLGPGGDPAMSLQGLGQLPKGVHLVAPAVPVVNLLRQQWFPSQNPLQTAGLGQTDAEAAALGMTFAYMVAALTASGLGAFIGWYHGGKRSGGKTGSKWGWGLAGFMFPVPTTVVAGVQGFGKRG